MSNPQAPQDQRTDSALEERRRRFAESITKQIETIDMEAERDFINSVTETITEPLKKIPEPVFREIFMPYFTGEKKPTEKDPAIAHWAGLVNGGTEAAEVVDMKGEVLFVVPPLYNSRVIDTLRKDRSQSFSSIFTEFADQSTVHKPSATREMAGQLAKKLDKAISTEDRSTASGWQKIREHYGLAPKQASAGQGPKARAEDDPDFSW